MEWSGLQWHHRGVEIDPMGEGAPEGDPYDWFHRAQRLMSEGNADAAVVLLDRVRRTEPSPSVLEALGRALFEARRYEEATAVLTELVDKTPDDDYAHYALGMALWRLQQFPSARDHLSMAFVMRPDRSDYSQALSQVKATLRARREAGLALNGPIEADFGGGSDDRSEGIGFDGIGFDGSESGGPESDAR
jgi:predicted Zn-dependent protease